MKIRLNNEEVKLLIEKYYEKKNERVSVTLKSSIRSVGYYEDKEAYGEVVLTKTIEVLGNKIQEEETLSKDELLGIFNEILSSEGYNVTGLTYDVGINQGGSYIWESNTPSAYFGGINLEGAKVKNVERKLNI